jgi:hypothetical protein
MRSQHFELRVGHCLPRCKQRGPKLLASRNRRRVGEVGNGNRPFSNPNDWEPWRLDAGVKSVFAIRT